ncbi:cytochrome b-c1 complex subunit 7-like [Venturia canescens]|uniref:cytochrome b-c1 complex subunit 7-like n=1 Tax=Venturia canescens TaxID=32260 RepID=UPI001C9BFAEB|nr:cytochrome b-c1 complex subunit 7-like [Venturia canescens]
MVTPIPRHFLINTGFRKWCYNLSGFNRYGLMRDDLLTENEVVKKALERLPQDVLDERNFRMIRAMQLNCQKIVLPKEQWTKFEEDVRYLAPYIEEVEKEMKEKADWNKE